MWALAIPIIGALGGGYLFVTRGKAHIGDEVEVMWKPGGAFGDQSIAVSGKVIEKKNPILGPYYTVQLYQLPKSTLNSIKEGDLLGINPDLSSKIIPPSQLSGLKDSDIVRNLTRKTQ